MGPVAVQILRGRILRRSPHIRRVHPGDDHLVAGEPLVPLREPLRNRQGRIRQEGMSGIDTGVDHRHLDPGTVVTRLPRGGVIDDVVAGVHRGAISDAFHHFLDAGPLGQLFGRRLVRLDGQTVHRPLILQHQLGLRGVFLHPILVFLPFLLQMLGVGTGGGGLDLQLFPLFGLGRFQALDAAPIGGYGRRFQLDIVVVLATGLLFRSIRRMHPCKGRGDHSRKSDKYRQTQNSQQPELSTHPSPSPNFGNFFTYEILLTT